jgi:hypothetical protein
MPSIQSSTGPRRTLKNSNFVAMQLRQIIGDLLKIAHLAIPDGNGKKIPTLLRTPERGYAGGFMNEPFASE